LLFIGKTSKLSADMCIANVWFKLIISKHQDQRLPRPKYDFLHHLLPLPLLPPPPHPPRPALRELDSVVGIHPLRALQ